MTLSQQKNLLPTYLLQDDIRPVDKRPLCFGRYGGAQYCRWHHSSSTVLSPHWFSSANPHYPLPHRWQARNDQTHQAKSQARDSDARKPWQAVHPPPYNLSYLASMLVWHRRFWWIAPPSSHPPYLPRMLRGRRWWYPTAHLSPPHASRSHVWQPSLHYGFPNKRTAIVTWGRDIKGRTHFLLIYFSYSLKRYVCISGVKLRIIFILYKESPKV